MDNETLFHEVMIGIGYRGRLDVPTQASSCDVMYNWAREFANGKIEWARSKIPGLPPIHFDFIDSEEINAHAFSCDGKYFIGLCAGPLVAFNTLFLHLLADKRVLRGIGNPDRESEKLPLLTLPIHVAQPRIYNNDRDIAPRDEERLAYAKHLRTIVFDYLLSHEIVHIANGHVDYLGKEHGLTALPEAGQTEIDPERRLDRQTIEMDADAIAGSWALSAIRKNLETKIESPLSRFYRTPAQALATWTFAISAYFRVFGDSLLSEADYSTITHPPDRARQAMMMSMSAVYLMDHWDRALAETTAIPINDAMLEVERAFALMTGEQPAIRGFLESWDACGADCMNRLLAHWKTTLRAKLLPYAYHKDLAD